jgi:hypothetical protein
MQGVPEDNSTAPAGESAEVTETVAAHEPVSAELEADLEDATHQDQSAVEEEHTPVAVAEPAEPDEASDTQSPEERPQGGGEPQPAFSFGRRDPHEKARRLARVLVSDMIVYNPQRHSQAVASGSLKDDFDEEIRKSWQEYRDQVGDELARTTPYFNDALNEILAQGNSLFP